MRRAALFSLASFAVLGGLGASLAASGVAPFAGPATGPARPRTSGARPVVLELFTSQGCSSCPPADALLRELARERADVLPLAFHVTYWNYLGWRDPYSFDGATQRQRAYARTLGSESIYTPQLVVDGRRDVVGSDAGGAALAIARAEASLQVGPSMSVRRGPDGVTIDVGTGSGAGTVFLVGYDPERKTSVGRGENAGRTLTEANIVRAFATAGSWRGPAMSYRAVVPEGERLAAFVQSPDGTIIAAARESRPEG